MRAQSGPESFFFCKWKKEELHFCIWIKFLVGYRLEMGVKRTEARVIAIL